MTLGTAGARSALLEARRLLGDPSTPADERIRRAEAVLDSAISEGRDLPPEARADLDASPTVQATVERIQRGGDGQMFMAGPDGAPTAVPFTGDADLPDLDEEGLAALGL